MRINLLVMMMIFAGIRVLAQAMPVDSLRAEAATASGRGDLSLAIEKYEALISLEPSDKDARFSLARLYFANGHYKESLSYYESLYKDDTANAAILIGIGRNNIWLRNYDEAVAWLKKAGSSDPGNSLAWLELGRVFSYSNQIDSAISAWERVLVSDPGNATALAGIGRMYNWKSEPVTAARYYRRSLDSDSSNKEFRDEYNNIRKNLRYNVNATFQLVEEKEPTYVIDAFVQSYSVSKRISNRWQAGGTISLDRSVRNLEETEGDTTRWYDNSWISMTYFAGKHRLGAQFGYSFSDRLASTYGVNWAYASTIKGLRISNTLSAGYTYFYYWTQAGKYYASENLRLSYKRWDFRGDLGYGIADESPVRKYYGETPWLETNPYTMYAANLNYILLKKPEIKLGAVHSWYNFEYKSTNYYSPYNRIFTGPSLTLTWALDRFYVYGTYSYMFGTEEQLYLEEDPSGNGSSTVVEEKVDVTNWSFYIEAGYSFPKFDLVFGGSRFLNPFYENFVVYTSLIMKL